MEIGTIFAAALQSSFMLGLLHGVNPCGHSWLVLVPFVAGEKSGERVALLTASFLGGTALACLVLGATLGTVSEVVPESIGYWVEIVTSVVLIVIGALLLYNPELLHRHSHHHCHDGEGHNHGSSGCSHEHHCGQSRGERFVEEAKARNILPVGLFVIGFVNMIVPCPTAAVMYGYALNSGGMFSAIAVFGVYAISTAFAVGGVIYLFYKASKMITSLDHHRLEPLIMRLSGVVIVVFSGYGVYHSINL